MKVYRNLEYITKRETLGRRLFLVAVLALTSGLMVSFLPNMEWARSPEAANPLLQFLVEYYAVFSMAALLVGFIGATVGSYFINRFAPRRWHRASSLERPDQFFARCLKGLGNQYALYLFAIPGVPHLLVGPGGMLAFSVRSDKGRVMVEGDRWREPFSLGRLFTLLSREGLGHPGREAEEYTRRINRFIEDMPEAFGQSEYASIPIAGAVAFINPEMTLEISNSSLPVVQGPELVKFVQKQAADSKVHRSLMRSFQESVSQYVSLSEAGPDD
ncbi:MAG: hypothetical protein OXC13_18225 [Caldilineaceae bacterium]|nr:hypothetical protein [Caldilineaceae bacterium]